MFLAAVNILGPIAAVCIFVVQQAADAQLLGSCAIPAGPVACARCLVAKYAIQPVTMFGGYGTICKRLVHWLQTRYSINSNMHCRSHRWSKSWTMPVGRHSLKHDDGCIMHIYQYTYSPIVCYRNNWIAMDSRSLRWRRDVCQQTPNHSDSHTIPVDYLCIPNIDRNTWHRRRRATLSCMDLLVWTSVRDNLQVEFNKKKNKKKRRKKKSILFHLQSEMETQSLGANCPRFPIVIH